MKMRLLLVTALCGLPALTAADTDKPPVVRLYVFTAQAPGAAPNDDEKGRVDAVREMRDALKHKAGLAIVDDRAQADKLGEIVGREPLESPSGGFGGKSFTNLGDVIIRLHVQAGDDQADLKGVGAGTSGRAAKDAAERVAKWVARHHKSPV
jgi:hypothetical protein